MEVSENVILSMICQISTQLQAYDFNIWLYLRIVHWTGCTEQERTSIAWNLINQMEKYGCIYLFKILLQTVLH